jgi:hypothetical protein
MSEMVRDIQKRTSGIVRGYVAVSFAVVMLWQLYQIFNMFRKTPIMKEMWVDFGRTLPTITQSYLNFYPWTIILPILTTLLAFDIIRRNLIPKIYSIVGFGVTAFSTLFLQAWVNEAMFAPIIKMAESIG